MQVFGALPTSSDVCDVATFLWAGILFRWCWPITLLFRPVLNEVCLLWWYLGSLQCYIDLLRCQSCRCYLGLTALVMGLKLLKVIISIHGPITLWTRLITLHVKEALCFTCIKLISFLFVLINLMTN